jgi:hypothetical protein
VFFTIPFVIVPGALPQLEMFVTRGGAPVTSGVLKIILLGTLVVAFVLRGTKIKVNQRLTAVAMMFFGFLLLDILHFYYDMSMRISDVLIGYNSYYMLDFLAILALLIPFQIHERYLYYMIGLIAPGCAALAIAQFVTNKPIVPTASGDGNFQVLVWKMSGHVRAFALFDAPHICAVFFIFITALLIALCRSPKHRLWAMTLLPVSIAVVLMSYARAQIISLLWGIVAAVLLTFWSGRGRGRLLPLYALLSAAPILLYGYITMGRSLGSNSLTTSNSFATRIREWEFYWSVVRNIPLSRILLGIGIIQTNQTAENSSAVPIDNIYLGGGLFVGAIGLILYLVMIWMIWEEIRQKAETRKSYLHTAVAATYSTFFLMGVFDLTPTRLAGFVILYAISDARIIPTARQDTRNELGKRAFPSSKLPRGSISTPSS